MIKEKMPEDVDFWLAIFDFMGFARQVPVRKSKLQKCYDLWNHLWPSFHRLPEDYEHTDIVFDLHDQKSIKGNEQNYRGKQAGILTEVSYDDQTLPVEMDELWLLSKNKVSFQQFFIKQLLTEDTGRNNCSQLL